MDEGYAVRLQQRCHYQNKFNAPQFENVDTFRSNNFQVK